jgi:heme exporter protein C
VPADSDTRARRCAVVALVAAADVPIVHFSVTWWRTLHQDASVLNADLSPTIHGAMAWTLLLGFVAVTLLFAWMLAVRYRIEALSERVRAAEIVAALDERRAEGASAPGGESSEASP